MKKYIYWALIALFSIIFIVSAVYVAEYLIDSHKYKNQLSDLQGMHTTPQTRPSVSLREPTVNKDPLSTTTPITTPTDPVVNPTESVVNPTDPVVNPSNPSVPTKPVMLEELVSLYKLNSDLVGYIYIEGTNVNNPVLQHKEEKDFYLYRDIFKDQNRHGSVYVRESCDVFKPTDVITIYGHNMADGTMFAHLHKYKKKDFFQSHPLVYFDTLYERHTYQVLCIFRTSATYGQGFPFHMYDDFADEAEFKEFVKGVRNLAIFDSGISVQYGDKFICLSTCEEWPIPDGRLVLVAVRID